MKQVYRIDLTMPDAATLPGWLPPEISPEQIVQAVLDGLSRAKIVVVAISVKS